MKMRIALAAAVIALAAGCGRERRGASVPAAAVDSAVAAAPAREAYADDPVGTMYSGFGSQLELLQALADSAARQAALNVVAAPAAVGPRGDTTTLLAALDRFTLAHRAGGDAVPEVWAAVNGTVVLDDSSGRAARVVLATTYRYATVRVVALEGGRGCPVMYRLIEYSDTQRPTVTPEFGNCAPPEVSRDEQHLQLRFAASAPGGGARPARLYDYLGHGRIWQRGTPAPPAFPDSLYSLGNAAGAINSVWRAGRYATARDSTDLLATMETPAGRFVHSRTDAGGFRNFETRARLGETLLMSDDENSYGGFYAYMEPRGRPVVVLTVEDGGNGCEALFRVVSAAPGETPSITGTFGSCSGAAAIWLEGARMDLLFEGYYTYWASEQPGFVPPPDEYYRFRGGARVDTLRAKPARPLFR